ncbi:MAG: S8 family serine peptidase, partial [Actinobacteria bacterium]|nr:S8 family serine peptidase [Actinomycetota bacterium]
MHTPRRRSRRPLLLRAAALAAVAALAAAVAGAGPVQGAGDSVLHAAAEAWDGLLGDRPAVSSGQRMIVVLEAPSLADRMAAAETPASPEDQKRWVAEADAAQRVLLARLAERGVELRRERSFTRTLNGFSAQVDSRALAALERTDGVAGLYPVRVVYPASVTSQVLTRPEYRAGAGRRPDVGLPGFEGAGVRIALLDTGVDLDHPYLNGRVLPGYDVADRDRRAAAEPKPDEPARRESHGTRMAGILVGSNGPAGLRGVAPAAQILPIRVLDWERAADGSYQLLGRGDVLIAGLERAVDPDADGDVDDAAAVALAAVVEPYASFGDSPEARSIDGAARLGTLVVAAAGNDGRGGRGFGTVGSPGGAPAAIGVGALDARAEVLDARTLVRVGAEYVLDERARVVGALPPEGALPAAALAGPTLADPRREASALADGATLADFFDAEGLSTVSGHAAILPAGPALETTVRNAVTAGATAVVVYGARAPAGSLDLDETTAIPVVAIPAEAGRAVVEGLARGEVASVSFGATRRVGNGTFGKVAPFSSGGVSFGGGVKPDLVAPGVGIATADAGTNADGSPRYATATGSSVAAAVVAGSAAVLAQARPGLTATELRSLLVGSAQQLVRAGRPDPVTVQGAGVVDPAAAAAAEVAVAPVTL